MTAFVVTGTDTGIGKTRFAAALTGALDGYYWKPIQAGLDEPTDSEIVVRPLRPCPRPHSPRTLSPAVAALAPSRGATRWTSRSILSISRYPIPIARLSSKAQAACSSR
jgi:dethiobiotin synthetase